MITQKTRIRNIILSSLLSILWALPNTEAFQLDKNFRTNLPQIIHELCHASIEYAITDTVEDKKSEYTELTNCLVNESLDRMTQHWNQTQNRSERAKQNQASLTFNRTDKTACENKRYTIGQVQSAQRQSADDPSTPGFKSQCQEQTGYAAELFSACQLSETLLVEYCGFSTFVNAKTYDYTSFKAEQTQAGTLSKNVNEADNQFAAAQYTYQQEIYAANTALTETLEFIRHYEKSYHQYTRWSVINAESQVMFQNLAKLAKPLFTFTRFVNATQK